MPPTSGQVGTFNRAVGVKVDMDEAVKLLTPTDVPLQTLLPGGGSTAVTKVEWMDEELLPQTVTNSNQTGASSPWTMTTTDTSHLRVGDVLAVYNGTNSAVQFVIDSITNATTYVVSGFAGNTTAPGASSTLEIIGQYRGEGLAPPDARSLERVAYFNYTQIGQEQVSVSRTGKHRGQRGGLYGQGDPYTHEVEKKFKELAIRFEKSLAHGQRAVSGDGTKRFMGGLFYFITSNTVSGVKANISALLDEAIEKVYTAGGSGRLVLMVSPAVKTIIDGIDKTQRRTTRTETTAGAVIDRYQSSFGEVEVVPNRHFPKTRGLVLTPEDDTIINFDPYFHELLAKTRDGDDGQIVGEKTLKVKAQVHQARFTVTDA
jgi:hypothetical protein